MPFVQEGPLAVSFAGVHVCFLFGPSKSVIYIFFYQNVTKIEAVIQVMAGTENGCDQSSLGAYL
jgi:hypothetical protein